MDPARHAISRRRWLAGAGAAVTAIMLPRPGAPQSAAAPPSGDGWRILRAQPGTAGLRGAERPATAIWGYEGQTPGPVLRVRRGEELKVRFVNDLPEPTVIHWHGLRLPNAMDGVPHLTQPPVAPGAQFEYRFFPPDAGTFWYHSHLYSSEQLDRGLYGALIVDEPQPADVDHDTLLVLDDWRLNADGSIDAASFRSMRDAMHDGRLGNHLTANGLPVFDIPVRSKARLRLRLLNAANARIMALRIDRHRATVMAIDGQPAEPFQARDARVVLGPGTRIDLFIDADLEPGAVAPIHLNTGRDEVAIARLVYDKGAPLRVAVRPDFPALPANPLPERMDFARAFRMDIPIEGGMMGMMGRGGMMGPGGMMGGRMAPSQQHGFSGAAIWTLAGRASDGHSGQPLFSVKKGRTVMLGFDNRTMFPHAMHLHGHHFRLLDQKDDGWKPFWLDTVIVPERQTWRIAFVADNPGKWMLHCHMLEHQETGMAAWFEVT